MNSDQQSNIDVMVRAISETLFSAWSYFHLLKGFHQGSKTYPIIVQKFGRLFDQIWRAIFDGLFVKVGTLIDRTKGTYSLPNLLTITRRYGEADLKRVANEVETRLNDANGPLMKIESWRHQVVAHRTPGGRDDIFFIENKMNLEEIAAGLTQLEELLNTISLEVLKIHNDTETGSEDLVQQGIALFSSIAEHDALQRVSTTNSKQVTE